MNRIVIVDENSQIDFSKIRSINEQEATLSKNEIFIYNNKYYYVVVAITDVTDQKYQCLAKTLYVVKELTAEEIEKENLFQIKSRTLNTKKEGEM